MLGLFSARLVKDCEGIRRRDFLKIGCLAGLGVSLPMAFGSEKGPGQKAGQTSRDVNCIPWCGPSAAPSHHDTFGPQAG